MSVNDSMCQCSKLQQQHMLQHDLSLAADVCGINSNQLQVEYQCTTATDA